MAKPQAGRTIMGTEGNDPALIGEAGNDYIYGYGGDDYLEGRGGNDTLYAHAGNDTISGGDGADSMAGGEGDDIVDGGAGNDEFLTGPGNDTLTGGLGADRFFFAQSFEVAMNHHTITDFSRLQGDYIDLRSMDADGIASNNTRKGNTDFTVVENPSGGAGEAWMVAIVDPLTAERTGTTIYFNIDADAEPEIQIDVLGNPSLTWGIDILG
jgi:Ca2+-binding RTX toxin-like protein